MKGICFCGKPTNPKYKELDCCSQDCIDQMFAVMTSIKNAMERQGSNKISYGLPEMIEAQMNYKELKNRRGISGQ